MRRTIALGVRFRVLVAGVVVLLMTVGLVQLRQARVAAFPQFSRPYVQVQTEAPGLSAAEVEQLVTVPLEQDLLNGVPWLDQMRSSSGPGFSVIDMFFQGGTSVLHARQVVQERLTQARALPNVGTPPVMIQPLASAGRALMIALSSKELSPVELSTLARWKIKPRLEGVAGVANVLIWGQRDPQLQVQIDPQRLHTRGVTLDEVLTTAGNAMWVSPLTFLEASTPGTGGFVDTEHQRLSIQHVQPITTPKDLAQVTVEGLGDRTVRLGDVSTVVKGNQPLIGDAVLAGGAAGVLLVVEQFPDADTRALTHSVDAALAALKPGLSGVSIDSTVYRPANYLDAMRRTIGLWALTGLVLFALLTALWFRSLRAALVALVPLGVSLVSALLVLDARGASLNLMVLAGLAVALVALIDDAVTEVLGIQRRLREPRQGRSAPSVVVEASAAARNPAMYATLALLLTTLPLLTLAGVGGAFARPMVFSFTLAVAASAVAALIVTPALAAFLLPGDRESRRPRPLARRFNRLFAAAAQAVATRTPVLAATIAVLLLAALAVVPQLGGRGLIPDPVDRDLLVRLQAPPGTSLLDMTRISATSAGQLRALSGIRSVETQVGRAVTGEQNGDVNSAELWVALDSRADYGSAIGQIKRTLQGFPGLSSRVVTYEKDRVDAVEGRHATTAPVVVRVYGQDLGVLRAKAEEVRQAVAGVPGVVRPQVRMPAQEPTVQIRVDLAAAQRYGIKPGDVRRMESTVFAGLTVGSYYQDQQVYDVVVIGTPEVRSFPDKVRDLKLDTATGTQVRLGDVASVQIAPFPTVVTHDGTSRSLDVTASVQGRDLPSVLGDVRARVGRLAMPYEFHAEVFSDTAAQQHRDLLTGLVAAGAAAGVLLLFQAAFRSWRLAGLALLALPLAAAGAVLTAFAVGGVMSAGALAGLLLVLVFAIRAVVLVVRDLQAAGPPTAARVVDVTSRRAASVLLTALITAAVLLPAAVAGPVAGFEVLHPLAVVALGGLVTTTLLALLVVPALYLRLAPTPVEDAAEDLR